MPHRNANAAERMCHKPYGVCNENVGKVFAFLFSQCLCVVKRNTSSMKEDILQRVHEVQHTDRHGHLRCIQRTIQSFTKYNVKQAGRHYFHIRAEQSH